MISHFLWYLICLNNTFEGCIILNLKHVELAKFAILTEQKTLKNDSAWLGFEPQALNPQLIKMSQSGQVGYPVDFHPCGTGLTSTRGSWQTEKRTTWFNEWILHGKLWNCQENSLCLYQDLNLNIQLSSLVLQPLDHQTRYNVWKSL